jgi:hypothetical protein
MTIVSRTTQYQPPSMLGVLLLAILVLALTVGCTPAPKVQIVTQVELKPIDIPDALLIPCTVTTPPVPAEYLALDYEGKEEMLTNYTISLIKDMGLCNGRLSNIRSVRDQQLQIYRDLKSHKE